jgi:hypothetical protein
VLIDVDELGAAGGDFELLDEAGDPIPSARRRSLSAPAARDPAIEEEPLAKSSRTACT